MARELKITRIGNSRGVRLPAETLKRYGITEVVVMEERSDGILLRPSGAAPPKLSWADTARAMAAAPEDWTAWDVTASEGLEDYHAPPRRPRR
jgi:antitoxin component of MazEF toxin-antitoxin module